MLRIVKYIYLALIFTLMTACSGEMARLNNAGNAQIDNGDTVSGLINYQNAQVLAPDRPEAYYNAGIASENLDDLTRAQASLEFAVRQSDEQLRLDALYNLGNVYFRSAMYVEAVEAYKAVLTDNPQAEDARYNMELALQYIVPPTPENQEQKTEPEEGETDPEATPTSQPSAQDEPTVTPPRQDNPPDPTATPEGGSGDFRDDEQSTLVPQERGRMSMDDAERLLDVIEQDLQSLSEFLQQVGESGEPRLNDW